jgi:RNA 2',3'-cyclic 3'-phosphodiesterase
MRRPRERRDDRRSGAGEAPRGVRSFVAVLLPEALRIRIDEAAAPLRGQAAGVSWVRADNLHLTLRFLGAIDEATIGRVREALVEAAAATAPFRIEVGGFGGFPSSRTPRVLWVGLTAGAEPLAALHAHLERALAARGIAPEGRGFHAHITLGRAREPRGVSGLEPVLGAAAGPLGGAPVEALHLMRSDLHPAGARYSVVAREVLAGASAKGGAR